MALDLLQLGHDLGGVGHRAGLAHGFEEQVRAVVEGRAEAVHRALVLGVVLLGVGGGAGQLRVDGGVHEQAFGGLLAGHVDDVLRGGAAGADDGAGEAELARLLGDEAGGAGRVAVELDRVDTGGEDAGDERHEVDAVALEELLRREVGADLAVGGGQVFRDLLAGFVVGEEGAHALDVARLHHPLDLRCRHFSGGHVGPERVGLVGAECLGGEAERHHDDLVLLGDGLDGQHGRRAHRADDVLDLVVVDEAVGHRHRFVGLVLVVVGDDLHLVLLAAHFEPALGIDVVGGQLGGVLHAGAPGGTGAREGDERADLERLLRKGRSAEGDEGREGHGLEQGHVLVSV